MEDGLEETRRSLCNDTQLIDRHVIDATNYHTQYDSSTLKSRKTLMSELALTILFHSLL